MGLFQASLTVPSPGAVAVRSLGGFGGRLGSKPGTSLGGSPAARFPRRPWRAAEPAPRPRRSSQGRRRGRRGLIATAGRQTVRCQGGADHHIAGTRSSAGDAVDAIPRDVALGVRIPLELHTDRAVAPGHEFGWGARCEAVEDDGTGSCSARLVELVERPSPDQVRAVVTRT